MTNVGVKYSSTVLCLLFKHGLTKRFLKTIPVIYLIDLEILQKLKDKLRVVMVKGGEI